jgi:hypothetical protein
MTQFLLGALSMACTAAGLFFVRFWLSTRDRLFLYFGLAFWVLAGHWTLIAVLGLSSENRPSLYLPRLLAFGLIIVGIADKNRSRP